LLILVLIGCDTPPDVPIEGDLEQALTNAYDALEDKLFEYNTTYDDIEDVEAPDSFDFTNVEALYQIAYDIDNSNETARFGLALSQLLSLSTNNRVNEAFDQWKAYLEDHWPFETPAKASALLDIPLGIPSDGSALELPFDLVTISALVAAKAQLTVAEPLVSDVQDILDSVVLPRIVRCIELLEPIDDFSGFTYMMSGRMQGSVDEDAQEVDQVELIVMLASCKLLQAGIGVAVSYDVEFGEYSGTRMLAGLNQDTGNIGTLIDGDDTRMIAVPGLFIQAVNLVDMALDVLQDETDNQDDDIIKIGPRDVNQNDIDEMQNVDLPNIRDGFASAGVLRTENWDGDDDSPETEIRINLLDFFNTPVEDFKALLPGYALQLAVDDYYMSEEVNEENLNVSIPAPASWSSYHAEYMFDTEISQNDYDIYPDFTAYCEGVIVDKLAELHTNPAWTGYAQFSFYDNEERPAGIQAIAIDGWISWTIFVNVPEIHWTDHTFAAWQSSIPDPTISGLFPGMTGSDLCATFGVLAEDWDPVMTFYWYDFNFGYDDPIGPWTR